jgi:2-deoxy-D-gluconate 3-dehydrogenase
MNLMLAGHDPSDTGLMLANGQKGGISLKDKIVVITGAGRGIGAATAELFAAHGANLLLTELPERLEGLQHFGERIASRFNTRVLHRELDIRRPELMEEAVRTAVLEWGRIDVLINNAGVNYIKPALQLTVDEWDSVVDVNLKGTFFMTQAAAGQMVRQRSGSIVFISSQHGIVGNENRAAYCASKAGLINLARALAIEWAKYGIRVNAVSPTFVHTGENDSVFNDPNFKRQQLPRIPLGRYAHPDDVAQAALFLSSDASAMITGHNLVVDGGWTAQ